MAHRKLGEPDFARDLRHRRLVIGPAPAVHQHDGERAVAGGIGRLQVRARLRLVERPHHLPAGSHPFLDLHDMLVERLGQDDVARENVGPRLVADPQRVAEPPGDRQRHRLALALEQGVGGDGRAHLHRLDRRRSALGQDLPDPRHRGVVIAFGIVRQQFARDQRPVRPARYDVGEGTATVDREGPTGCVHQDLAPFISHPQHWPRHEARRAPAQLNIACGTGD